jgi:glycosyltransferase involved in cell wall biosynthesis
MKIRPLFQEEERPLHVLMVSNHLTAKKEYRFSGIFIDRQNASLTRAGVSISTFSVRNSHSPFYIFRQLLKLRSEVRRLRPDLVHGQYGTIVGALAAFSGCTSVISFCGSDLLRGASVSTTRMLVGFLLSNVAALRATRIICKSEELRQALWWRKSRAVVIPSGIDLDFFLPGPQEDARKELGWNTRHPVVLFNAARDPANKGFDLANVAMEELRRRVPEAGFHVISNVEPSQMAIYYRAADVLLCASKQEGSPNVVKEALACNLPVVSVPVGDVPERLTGVDPSAVVPRNPKAIAKALERILLTRNRSNGRDHVAHLALDHIAQLILAVYRQALPNHHGCAGRLGIFSTKLGTGRAE